jgi:hypothetical protein
LSFTARKLLPGARVARLSIPASAVFTLTRLPCCLLRAMARLPSFCVVLHALCWKCELKLCMF